MLTLRGLVSNLTPRLPQLARCTTEWYVLATIKPTLAHYMTIVALYSWRRRPRERGRTGL